MARDNFYYLLTYLLTRAVIETIDLLTRRQLKIRRHFEQWA